MAAQVAGFDSLLTGDRKTGLDPTLTDHRRLRRGPAASLPGCAGAVPCTALQRLQGTINSLRTDAHEIRQELSCQPGAAAESGEVFMPRCCGSTHRLYLQGGRAGALVESRLGVRTAGKPQKPLHVGTLTSEASVSTEATRGRCATLELTIATSESPSECCLGCCATQWAAADTSQHVENQTGHDTTSAQQIACHTLTTSQAVRSMSHLCWNCGCCGAWTR